MNSSQKNFSQYCSLESIRLQFQTAGRIKGREPSSDTKWTEFTAQRRLLKEV